MNRPLPLRRLPLAAAALGLLLAASSILAATADSPWTIKDPTDHALTVPAPDKPTLLLFLRPGHAQSDEAARLAATLVKDRPLQVITILSGDDVAKPGPRPAGPLIIDKDFAHSGRFAVRVWPTAVVLPPAGRPGSAHLAGVPVTFANDLAAHLDHAAGKLDKAALDKALAARDVVADSAAQKAARHAEVALRHATAGMTDQAQAELAKAADLKPADPPVLLAMARVHLVLGDPKSAAALLAQIKDGAIPAGQLNTLRGWAAVEAGDWPEAKKLLTAAAMLNPDPAEAFYLLARVHEHEKDLPTAAQYYRKAFERTPTGKSMGPPSK